MIKKSYRIFVLFILVSISIFSDPPRTRLEKVDTRDYKEIKVNLFTVTYQDPDRMELLDVKETREGMIKGISTIQMEKLPLKEVIVNGKNYKVGPNNQTIENIPEYAGVDYVYGWQGTYTTKFEKEEGKKRDVSFTAKRYMKAWDDGIQRFYNEDLAVEYIEPNAIIPNPNLSNQWIYTEVTKKKLKKTDQNNYYSVSFYDAVNEMRSLGTSGRSPEEVLKRDTNYVGTNFIQRYFSEYLYNGKNRPMVEFKLTKNESSNYIGTFKFITGSSEQITQNYNISAPTTDFREVNSEGNAFTYSKNNSNNNKYGDEEIVFRLYKGDKFNDVRPVKTIKNNDDLTVIDNGNNYVDFVFKKNEDKEIILKDGVTAKFQNGKFEIIGLESGTSYKLDLYTLRYGTAESNKKYVVATYEDSLEFIAKNPTDIEEKIWLDEIDVTDYKDIKLNILTLTNRDISELKIDNLKEKREGLLEGYPNILLDTPISLAGTRVKINGIDYNVDGNNQVIFENNKKGYVYKWRRIYETKFTEEKGLSRDVDFEVIDTSNSTDTVSLSGSYTEPNDSARPKQWIYSQITKSNLVNSNKYIIDFYEDVDTIKTVDEDGNLEELLRTDGGYSEFDNFNQLEQERYEYIGFPKSIIEFKLQEPLENPKKGKLELEIEENNVLKRKINENYTIPVPITNFEEQNLELSKNTFTYKDNYELENLKAFKYQEVVFRLYTKSKHDEVRPIKKIEETDFNNINNSYIDFVFKNNGSAQVIEKDGIKGRFIEGKFELMGLENDRSYNLDFYTLRYRDNDNKGNYVAVTYEGGLDFLGKNISSTEEGAWIEDIDITEYKKIKLDIMTVTSEALEALDILDLDETRVGEIRSNNDRSITGNKVILDKVWIDGKEYEIINDQITLENNEKKYVYKWSGSYDTKFEEEEGEIRKIKFAARGYKEVGGTFEGGWLTGEYIEPTPVEVDTGEPHQWVMFEFNPEKEFINQNYKIEDRILIPKREGYKQLKTIAYDTNLVDYLDGKSEHSLISKFTYSNGVWNYPVNNSSTGFIIEKTITESKGILKGEDNSELIFYTDEIGDGIEKLEESGNKVTFRWNEGPLNTNGEILNYDKVIFRITKKNANVDYSWNPYENQNPINYIDETVEGNNRLEEFLFGNDNYVDLILGASTSETITLNNAIISYEQTNKELRIVGLPVEDYIIQFYSVKRGHDGEYKVVTRENQSEFHIDISDIVGPDFEKENNIHKIDFITTGTSSGAIQVNVNFITKMEREIDLEVKNLKSGIFNIEETNEGTGEKKGIGEVGNITLKESDMKRFLFPLDVIFVIDNSASMQNEIDNVKNGLSDFGQELLDRGFDVKYNLITFGPKQNNNYYYNYYNYGNGKLYPTGNWHNTVSLGDRGYMAIYKNGENNKWFNGSTLNKTSSRENDLEELVDAFDNINALWGYDYGQENSAWGIHYAIEKLRENGRYLSYSGEIVEESSTGYMPSEKMIIFLTDENMDQQNLPSKYSGKNVLEEISKELADKEFNGMPDIIDLNGIFHIRKRGNDANGASTQLTKYGEEGVPGLGYKYSTGIRRRSGRNYYWEEYDDNETPILGIDPADDDEIFHTDFKYYNTANNFFMYEMKNDGSGIKDALDRAINNLGIIQRWELSYLTPFNEYDGTTRTVDFELVDLEGRDGVKITRDIKNLNEEKDKQYTVKKEKLALEFEDPSVDNLKLSIIDGVGTITFLGKARYNEFDEDNNPIVVEDMINEYKLDVLDSNNKLLFTRNTDNIEMSLSDEGWLDSRVTKNNISKVLAGRKKSWVHVINNSGKDILKYIDKARYTIEEGNTYKIEFMSSEVEKIKILSAGDLKLNMAGSDINIDEEEFKELMKDRSDTWYELKNTSGTPDLLDDLENNDFEVVKDNEYRIKLGNSGLKKLLGETGENNEGIELKISNTKLEELSNKENLGDTFGEQGWYQFKVVLTEDEIQTLINSETVKSTEKINLEARIVTDLFNKTGVLKDVKVDLSTPKITNVSLENKTLFNFLNTMKSLDKNKTFSTNQVENYSGYDGEIGTNYVIPNDGNYGKSGDKIDLELIVEGKNIDEYDVAKGIGIDGWSNPKIEPYSNNASHKLKKFKVSWKNEVISISGASNAVVKNDIKNQFGFTASQDITVLKFDNEIEVFPKVKGIQIIDNIYYVNSDYNIDLGTADTGLRSGIAILDYDKTQADTTKDGDYYGKYEKYYEIEKPIFGGGTRSGSIPVVIDSGDNHSTDGEYSTQIYGMSRSGKLDGVTNYFDGDFKTVMKNSSSGENIIVRVDTVAPRVTNVLKEESNETSDENYYNFDVSFDIEDFNASYKKLDENIKGGYLLKLKNDNTEILDEPVYDGNKTVAYKIKVKKPKVSNGLITEVTIIAEDKAGNRKEEKVKIRVPKDIKLKVYEEIQGWGNGKKTKIKDSEREYIFTKGGAISLINDPVIYAVVPKSTGPDDDTKITKLKIEKLNESENPVAEKILDLSGGSENVEIKFNFSREGKNRVRVTPISKVGIEGKPKELNFILDTRINTSYLDNEIIGSLKGGDVEIDLSKIEELSGVEGYEYIFSVEGKVSEKVIKRGLKGKSFITPKEGSISGTEIIDTSTFIGGSNGILLFTVYDNLGHRKTFEKTYFIPKESDGIIAKISGEAKQRESKLRIVTSGIELESTIDRSSEYESDDENEDSEDSLNKI